VTAVKIFSVVTDSTDKDTDAELLDNLPLSCPMPKNAFIFGGGRAFFTIGPYLQHISPPDRVKEVSQVLQLIYESDSYRTDVRPSEIPPSSDVVNLSQVAGDLRHWLSDFFENLGIDIDNSGGSPLRKIQPADIDHLFDHPSWSHVNVILFKWITGVPNLPAVMLAAVRWRAVKLLQASYPRAIRIPTTGELLPVHGVSRTSDIDAVP